MSNRNAGESPAHRKPKVSLAMVISQGLGGPNPFTERWTRDGQPVNIPALLYLFLGWRSLWNKVYYWIYSWVDSSDEANLYDQATRKSP